VEEVSLEGKMAFVDGRWCRASGKVVLGRIHLLVAFSAGETAPGWVVEAKYGGGVLKRKMAIEEVCLGVWG
jgi:hypothetical protein